MKKLIWPILFFILLFTNVIALSVNFSTNQNEEIELKEQEIQLLKSKINEFEFKYLENAKQLKYVLESILENSAEIQKFMSEYNDVSNKDFEEKIRQKIVRLDIELTKK